MSITFRLRHARIPAALLCASVILSACQDSVLQAPAGAARAADAADPLVQRIVAMGFNPAGIQDAGDRYVVEGDIVFDKDRLGQVAGPLRNVSVGTAGPRHQYVVNSPILQSVMAQGLRISLANISSSSAWTTAARQAITEWNGAGGNKIKFVEVTTGADITVMFGSGMPSNHIAEARYPVNGYPGWQIDINTSFNSLSAAKKKHAMAHELGHTVGFRHANYPVDDPAPGGANYIAGTPTSDANSVMFSTNRSWSGFSTGDYTASAAVYPADAPAITSQGYDSSGNFTLSWNAVTYATQYRISYDWWFEEWVVDPFYYPNGGYYAWTPSSYTITTTSSTTFSDPGQGTGASPNACAYWVTPIYPSGKEGRSVRSQDVTC